MIQASNAYSIIPYHRYLLNETSGTNVTDIGRAKSFGTMDAGLTLNQSGPDGRKSIQWDGTGVEAAGDSVKRIVFDGTTGLKIDNKDFSFSLFIKITHKVGCSILGKDNNVGANEHHFGIANWPDANNANWNSDHTYDNVMIAVPTLLNVWYHVVYSYIAATKSVKIYRDGVLIVDGTHSTAITSTDSGFWCLGAFRTSEWGVNQSYLSDLCIYDYALSSVEAKNLYNCGNTISIQRDVINNPSPTVLWNKLENSNLISEIGYDGAVTGTVTFANDCKFNKGITPLLGDGSARANFNAYDINSEHGSIEFWAKFYDAPQAFVYGVYDFINNAYEGGLQPIYFFWHNPNLLGAYLVFNGTAILVSTESFSPPLNTNVHIALVWDRSGIEGTSDYIRIYYDGNVIATKSDNPNWGTTPYSGTFRFAGGWNPDFATSRYVLDNLQIKSYAKTDFSDRFQERPAVTYTKNIQVDSNVLENWTTFSNDSEILTPKIGSDGFINSASRVYNPGPFSGTTALYKGTGLAAADADGVEIMFGPQGTMEFWIKMDGWGISNLNSTDTDNHALFEYYPNSSGTAISLMNLPHHGQGIYWDISTPFVFTRRLSITNSTWDANTWYHVALTWDYLTNTMKMYRDGIDLGGTQLYDNLAYWTPQKKQFAFLQRGNSLAGVSGFKGWIYGFKHSNYAKSDFSDRFLNAPTSIQDLIL